MAKNKRKKFRAVKWEALTWIILLISFLALAFVIFRFPLIPGKWKLIIIAAAFLPVLIMSFFSLRKRRKRSFSVTAVINILLTACILIAAILIPGVTKQIDEIFADLPETDETTINVYALTTEYKSAHSDKYREKGVSMITDPDLANYKNRQFITQNSVDQDNQEWAIGQIKELFGTDSLWENRTDTVWTAVRALYEGEGEALILNQAYITTIAENAEFASFLEDTIVLKTFSHVSENEKQKMALDTKQPFAFLIAGSDSRDAALTTVTRTDVDILAAVNPGTREILLVSFPRDSYIANPALGGGLDKLTHMGIYGIDNTTAALSQFLGLELNNYVLVNFNTYESIINTLGGVDIVNPYQFSSFGYTFPAGNIHLSGAEALAYVRERYSLANGDFDRNEHQVIVLKAMIRKILSPDVISRYSEVLEALSGTFLTNIKTESIYELAAAQMESMSAWTISSRHIEGSTGGAECASAPGELLSVVFPDMTVAQTVADEVKTLLGTGE